MMMRRFDEAISAARRALELDPAYPWAHRWLGEACLLTGQYEEAENAFSRIEAPLFAAGLLGYCYARTNREPQARQLLAQLQNANCANFALQISVLHLGLGEQDLAVECLKRACGAHVPGINWLNIEPIWDELRPHAGFTESLRCMGLAG